jgi:hypothetical protein
VDEVADRQSDPLRWPPPLWQKIREGFGRTADGRKVSPATKNTWIVNIRMMFTWAKDYHLNALPRWGSASKTVRKRLRQEHRFDFQWEHGQRVFDAGAARKILDAVDADAQRAGLNRNNTSGFSG